MNKILRVRGLSIAKRAVERNLHSLPMREGIERSASFSVFSFSAGPFTPLYFHVFRFAQYSAMRFLISRVGGVYRVFHMFFVKCFSSTVFVMEYAGYNCCGLKSLVH